MLFPLRLAAASLALTLSMTAASAAESVTKDSAPAVAAQPAADKPVAALAVEKTSTDLGAARVAAKPVVAPARVVRRAPHHARLNCTGPWCGRQFVLMLGTAY